MADRWTDERDRDWRDRDWQRSERFGRGREQDRERQFGQQDREREDRTFDPRGGYDDDRGYNQDRYYGAEDRGYGEGGFGGRGYGGGSQGGGWGEERGSRYGGSQGGQYGGSESGYSGRYQSGYEGGYRGGESWGGERRGQDQDRSRFGAQLSGPERDRVFGERETGASYRPGGAAPQGANYGGTPEYGREPGRAGRLFGSQEHGREQFGGPAYGSQGGQSRDQQREYGRGGEHFGQPYGEAERHTRGEDYRAGGRFYGDDAREPIYREEYGQGGREYGAVPAGYDSPRWTAAEPYGGRGGAASRGSAGLQREGERWRNRDEREHHTPNVREGRGEGRSWWDRTKNQVASFFGDEDAERRTEWDRQNRSETEGHRGRGPKGYKRSDERITEEVNLRLTDDPWVDASDIDVQVKECEVTLSGTVSDREERRRAERVVEDIWGVTHVQNNIRVQDRQRQQGYGQQGYGGENPREGAGSVLGAGSSDTSSRNPITGTGHGFGDTMLAAGDPAAAGAASLTDAGRTGTGGQGQTTSAAQGSTDQTPGQTGSSTAPTSGSTGKDRNK